MSPLFRKCQGTFFHNRNYPLGVKSMIFSHYPDAILYKYDKKAATFFYVLILLVSATGCFSSRELGADETSDYPDDSGIEADSPDAQEPFAEDHHLSNQPVCGNGIIEAAEVCDDGNDDNDDTCSSDCTQLNLCPDGVLEGDFTVPNRSDLGLALLEKCTIIDGNLYIKDADLQDIEQLGRVTEISGDLIIGATYGVDSPEGGFVDYVDTWSDRIELNDLGGFEALTTIGGTLTIGDTTLTDFTGLNHLRSIGGDLVVWNNDELTSLDGLDALETIGGSLIIEGCGFLEDLRALSRLERIAEDLSIEDNTFRPDTTNVLDMFENRSETHLTNLDGFENLRSVGGDVKIMGGYPNERWTQLSDIDGLRSLESIGGTLWLERLDAGDLKAFANLTSVGKDVVINRNSLLESLLEPNAALTVGGRLYITGNALLPTCDALALRTLLDRTVSLSESLICSNKPDACEVMKCPRPNTTLYPGAIDHWLWIIEVEANNV